MAHFGPDNAALRVNTYREGVAAKAGHDLVIEVTGWEASLDLEAGTVELSADPHSLEVREGLHGVKPLTDRDRREIRKNIDDKVLHGQPIRFSGTVRREERGLIAAGELTLAGATRRISAWLDVADDGRVSGTFPVAQSGWGIKPYRGLMGALKVRDEVEVTLEARLPR